MGSQRARQDWVTNTFTWQSRWVRPLKMRQREKLEQRPLSDQQWAAVKVTQSCPTLCDPTDYTVPGILQARILEWVVYPFSRGSSRPRSRSQESNQGLLHCRWILYQLSFEGKPQRGLQGTGPRSQITHWLEGPGWGGHRTTQRLSPPPVKHGPE